MAFVSARIASKSGFAMMAGSGNWEKVNSRHDLLPQRDG
ncbi:Uncharacterised protein [Escherichia coli]|uniref:Uncharacterized protein n=1 Tax=Escherichia coli TaxID=562 RepID=A0A2X1LFD3_ECOLX|nr:Uncharacterised protein [Escherichia coli]